ALVLSGATRVAALFPAGSCRHPYPGAGGSGPCGNSVFQREHHGRASVGHKSRPPASRISSNTGGTARISYDFLSLDRSCAHRRGSAPGLYFLFHAFWRVASRGLPRHAAHFMVGDDLVHRGGVDLNCRRNLFSRPRLVLDLAVEMIWLRKRWE